MFFFILLKKVSHTKLYTKLFALQFISLQNFCGMHSSVDIVNTYTCSIMTTVGKGLHSHKLRVKLLLTLSLHPNNKLRPQENARFNGLKLKIIIWFYFVESNINTLTSNSSEAGVLHRNNPRNKRKIIKQYSTIPTISVYSRRQGLISENLQHHIINITTKQQKIIKLNLTNKKLMNDNTSNNTDLRLLYECRICRRQFIHNCSLQFHKRTHTGEKLYRCNVCRKIFTREKNLIKHKKIHNL